MENGSQLAKKRAYKLNLTDLHSVCEANYVRFMRLYPDYESSNSRCFTLGRARVQLEVAERCRYTTIFRVLQQGSSSQWLGGLKIEVRVYHDARMAEVGMFQSHRRVEGRYQYPNKRMYQQDEKCQQNQFLADWLEHCLCNGLSDVGSVPFAASATGGKA